MRTRSTLICSFSALFCASSSSISSFRLSLSSESSVSGGIPDLNQPRVMRSMPKARVKPTQTGEQLQFGSKVRDVFEGLRLEDGMIHNLLEFRPLGEANAINPCVNSSGTTAFSRYNLSTP